MAVSQYLLDTNILSDLIRNPGGAVASKISQVGEKNVFTSIIVAAELRFGAEKLGSAKLIERVNGTLRMIDVRNWGPPADEHYASIRSSLEKQGKLIGGNDMLIAAHARASNAIVVTANKGEFSRVDELTVENWLAS